MANPGLPIVSLGKNSDAINSFISDHCMFFVKWLHQIKIFEKGFCYCISVATLITIMLSFSRFVVTVKSTTYDTDI